VHTNPIPTNDVDEGSGDCNSHLVVLLLMLLDDGIYISNHLTSVGVLV